MAKKNETAPVPVSYTHLVTLEVEGSSPFRVASLASVAQSVEQGTENPRVGGSIPPLGTI